MSFHELCTTVELATKLNTPILDLSSGVKISIKESKLMKIKRFIEILSFFLRRK